MFNGEESIHIRTNLPPSKIEEIIEEEVAKVGTVELLGRGEFKVSASKFRSFLTDASVDGKLSKGRKEGEWSLRIEYHVKPSTACWVIVIVTLLFCWISPLLFFVPYTAKNEVQRTVERAVRDVREAVETPG